MKILFTTENMDWGGSELLWNSVANYLSSTEQITICVNEKIQLPEKTRHNNAITIRYITKPTFTVLQKIYNRIVPYSLRLKHNDSRIAYIKEIMPDLVVINQGYNFNGVDLMAFCIKCNIKYVTISQAVNELYWPNFSLRVKMKNGFEGALTNYFVSNDNLNVTESQIGEQLVNAQVVKNPFNVPYDVSLTYPTDKESYKLAFVGRYFFSAKGQDILLRVLNQEKWRDRNLIINFYGNGRDKQNLIDLIALYKLENVFIKDFTPTLDIWRENHGLILTSRYEGLPIALVEAMLCSRIAIITNVSGSAEVVTHKVSGFVAEAPRVKSVDCALELAWQNRKEWQHMGVQSRREICRKVEKDPEITFAKDLLRQIKAN
ncbi:glycosyltransferase family 4 protein [Bizionia gelidisalsuginis]|uniref:Glycosyltransferase family 4 protein n=1 Tax=Bizionia gelidisalsuginis TaxID=291188 RepID=A0ABY3MDK1_9FLAO|nr:glycosyltransferase family 4 protein [Bizionia gelidisalsuginis]TYC17012.1 glycosyltransferase family 4 protein [Bizionia gelidisalsuginis]